MQLLNTKIAPWMALEKAEIVENGSNFERTNGMSESCTAKNLTPVPSTTY